MNHLLERASIMTFVMCSFAICTMAQIPTDFEFLDHSQDVIFLGAFVVTENGVIYVCHNQTAPMTTINRLGFDNSKETLAELEYASRFSRVIVDGNVTHILVSHLIDYDVSQQGYYLATVIGDAVNVDDRTDFPSEVYDLSFVGNNLVVTSSPQSGRVYVDPSDNGYTYRNNEIRVFTQPQGTPLLETPRDILGIIAENNLNYILTRGQILAYNIGFQELQQTWDIPFDVLSTDLVDVSPSGIVVMSGDPGSYAISEYDLEGQLVGTTSLINEPGDITGFNKQGDEYLVYGYHDVSEISLKHGFFRNVVLGVAQSYQRTDVSPGNFRIEYVESDTVGGNSPIVTYKYAVSATISNHTNEEIAFHNSYSRFFNFRPGPFDQRVLFDETSGGISAMEELDASYDLLTESKDMSAVVLLTSGANFKFNESDDVIVPVDFKSTVAELSLDSDLRVFPNPAIEKLEIKTENPLESITIYSSQGQLMYHQSGQQIDKVIDLDNLTTGSYYLIVKDEEGHNRATKFVKHH